jgi:hypothetical protein
MRRFTLETHGMLNHLKLRTLYAMHMLLPLALVEWHHDRLNADTLTGLLTLFR